MGGTHECSSEFQVSRHCLRGQRSVSLSSTTTTVQAKEELFFLGNCNFSFHSNLVYVNTDSYIVPGSQIFQIDFILS